MRLWSLHPKYLDSKGLTACWREGLLARKVLLGQSRGYRNHPQLIRFRATDDPVASIDVFLSKILKEAQSRGYKFSADKIDIFARCPPIAVTKNQLKYELSHLRSKLVIRDKKAFEMISYLSEPLPNSIFYVVDGEIEDWEIIKK